MRSPHRWLAVAIVLAGVSAPATAADSQSAPRQQCSKLYTRHMFARAARIVYRGTRTPTRSDYGALHKFQRCQHTLDDSNWALSFWGRARASWQQRRYDAAHPWHGGPGCGTCQASMYDDSGTHCCGVYAAYGVATCGGDICFPQGTRVEFSYGGRTVTATVDDHGPYVAGRDWDLNQNTASALGFDGLGDVYWRVL